MNRQMLRSWAKVLTDSNLFRNRQRLFYTRADRRTLPVIADEPEAAKLRYRALNFLQPLEVAEIVLRDCVRIPCGLHFFRPAGDF